MRMTLIILAVLIGLLSIAAGAAKVSLVSEEVAFLGQFGLSNIVIMIFGVVQVAGGILLMIPKTRTFGGVVAGIAFLVSAVLLLIAGNVPFAGVSLIPVVAAFFVAFKKLETETVNTDDQTET